MKVMVIARIATSVFFLLFGEYKVTSPVFAHDRMPKYLAMYINEQSAAIYRPFLVYFVQPHPVFWGYVVGIGELLIGLSLLLGVLVRPASVLGMIHMLNLTLATWNGAGEDALPWQVAANQLGHVPLFLLLLIFWSAAPDHIMPWRRA